MSSEAPVPVHVLGARAKAAAKSLALASTAAKNAALLAAADLLVDRAGEILAANAADVDEARVALAEVIRLAGLLVEASGEGDEWFASAHFRLPEGNREESRQIMKALLSKRRAAQPLQQLPLTRHTQSFCLNGAATGTPWSWCASSPTMSARP